MYWHDKVWFDSNINSYFHEEYILLLKKCKKSTGNLHKFYSPFVHFNLIHIFIPKYNQLITHKKTIIYKTKNTYTFNFTSSVVSAIW